MTPYQHIMEGHIFPVTDPNNSYYVSGNSVTGPADPQITWFDVKGYNRQTFKFGNWTAQKNTNIAFKLNFPRVTIDFGMFSVARYGIGNDKAGKWLTVNTLVVASDCKSAVTSFPSPK